MRIIVGSWTWSVSFILIFKNIIHLLIIVLSWWRRFRRYPFLIISDYLWNKYATRFVLINWKDIHFVRIVLTWSRRNNFLFSWNTLSAVIFLMPHRSFISLSNSLGWIILSWAHHIFLTSSMNFLSILLLNKISCFIFFIAKDVLMRRYRRRIDHLIPYHMLPFRLCTDSLILGPSLFIGVRSWTRSVYLLFDVLFSEPLNSRCKTITRLYHCYPKLL